MAPSLEIPIFGARSATKAVELGAGRFELNAAKSYKLGGTTPSLSDLSELKEKVASTVPVRVMIRPRGSPPSSENDISFSQHDFIYSDEEFSKMKEAVTEFKASGLLSSEQGDGFVFGILSRVLDSTGALAVDVRRNTELVHLAAPFKCVFHRAFDDLIGSAMSRPFPSDENGLLDGAWQQALQDVQSCGFDGVLTSGGPGSAPDNLNRLADIVKEAGEKLEIIVGGGVRSSNVQQLSERLDAPARSSWFHSSCLTTGVEDEGAINAEELTGILRRLS